jgi:hypothetical protein
MHRTIAIILLVTAAGCGTGKGRTDAEDTAVEDVLETVEEAATDLPDAPDVDVVDTGCTTDDDCDDVDPCTEDTCDTSTGECTHADVDADGDDYPAEAVDGTACGGTDCNDDDETTHPGAIPVCDGEDHDCDGVADNDVDEDGYLSEALCGSGGDDCDDTDDTIHPGADEVCEDGVDQDCDDIVDGPIAAGPDVRVTTTTTGENSYDPSLAFTGSGFGVAWTDERHDHEEIYFATISATGSAVGTSIRITTSATDRDSTDPWLVWTGSEFGLAWADFEPGNQQILVARLDATGSRTASDVQLTTTSGASSGPSLVWTGSEYGVSWIDKRDTVRGQTYFARLDVDATAIGSQLRVVDTGDACYETTAAWTGSEFGVTWLDWRNGRAEVYLARIDAAGAQVGTDIRVTDHDSTKHRPFLSWSGSAFAVAWEDSRSSIHPEVFLALLDPVGTRTTSDVRLSEHSQFSQTPALAFTGSAFAVVWSEDGFVPGELAFTRVSTAGAEIDDEIQLTSGGGETYSPSVVWTGSEVAVAWQDTRYFPPTEILFNRVVMCD